MKLISSRQLGLSQDETTASSGRRELRAGGGELLAAEDGGIAGLAAAGDGVEGHVELRSFLDARIAALQADQSRQDLVVSAHRVVRQFERETPVGNLQEMLISNWNWN